MPVVRFRPVEDDAEGEEDRWMGGREGGEGRRGGKVSMCMSICLSVHMFMSASGLPLMLSSSRHCSQNIVRLMNKISIVLGMKCLLL